MLTTPRPSAVVRKQIVGVELGLAEEDAGPCSRD
jgi:hypothetical protein